MSVGRGGAEKSAGGDQSAAEQQTMLSEIALAVEDLAADLETAGLTQQLRESPSCNLRSLDRSLPAYPLEELLLACEAYATVTAPTALAADDFAQVREEAEHLLQSLRVLAGVGRSRRRLPGKGFTSTGTDNFLLRSAFTDTQVQASLNALLDALSPLADIKDGEPEKRKRALRIGPGCLIPATVLGGAIALVVFLLSSFALATGHPAVLPGGLSVPALSNGSSAAATATTLSGAPIPGIATPTPATAATATSSGSGGTPTQPPVAAPTATTPPGVGRLSLSKSTVTPCVGSSDSFTITYSSGQQPVSWSASWSDHTNVTVSPSNGTLQPGGSTSITVSVAIDLSTPGTITMSASNGVKSQTITYDASNC